MNLRNLNEVIDKKYDFIVVGSGLAGAVFANFAGEKHSVLVIDKRSHIAGNVYTERKDNIDIHMYGSHIFHTNDDAVWRYVNMFAEFNDFRLQVVAKATNSETGKKQMFQLPFNMMTFQAFWPELNTVEEIRDRIAKEVAEANIANPQNLEEQAISMVGRTVYETLIKGYTEKQWGKKCTELPAYIIQRLPIRFNYDNTYFYNAKYQGIPKNGYTDIVKKMLNWPNIDVVLETDYIDNRTQFESMLNENGKIIYSGAIDELCDYRFGQLEYRTLRFEHMHLDTPDYQGNSLVNFPDADIEHTRITEHKHYNDMGSATTYISKEYPEDYVPGKNDPYYPIGGQANREIYNKYADYVAENMQQYVMCGRLGTYKYLDMDKVIKETAEISISVIEKFLSSKSETSTI